MENVNVCGECKHTYKRFGDLRRHVKTFHPEKLEELAPLNVKSYQFQCTLCRRNFNHKKNFNAHFRTHSTTEDNSVQSSKVNENVGKKCPLCDYMGKFKVDLIKHFQLFHNIDIDSNVEKLHFSSSDNFSVWLSYIEKDTLTKYIVEKRDESKSKIYVSYICHRSGFFISRSTGLRRPKAKGSKKINGFCPAGLQVFIDKEGGNHEVTYVKSHVGHQNDLSHFIKKEREMIATNNLTKISLDDVLDEKPKVNTTNQVERTLADKKKELIEIMMNEINSIESEKELLTAENILVFLGPTLRAIRQGDEVSIGQRSILDKTVSGIKKKEQQGRLFSSNKKNKQNNKRI